MARWAWRAQWRFGALRRQRALAHEEALWLDWLVDTALAQGRPVTVHAGGLHIGPPQGPTFVGGDHW